MSGKSVTELYGIGVGPGDPDLITLKAARLIAQLPVLAYPAPLEGESLARRIAAAHIPAGAIEIPIRMPMSPAHTPAFDAYDRAAREIDAHLKAGRKVGVLCEGDPLLYGSFVYLLERLGDRHPATIVPGVSSMMACAALARFPLATQDASVALAPASLPEAELERRLAHADSAVLFKVGRHLDTIARVLERLGMAEGAVYVARAGQPGETILPLAEAQARGGIYFAMVLARKPAR